MLTENDLKEITDYLEGFLLKYDTVLEETDKKAIQNIIFGLDLMENIFGEYKNTMFILTAFKSLLAEAEKEVAEGL